MGCPKPTRIAIILFFRNYFCNEWSRRLETVEEKQSYDGSHRLVRWFRVTREEQRRTNRFRNIRISSRLKGKTSGNLSGSTKLVGDR